MAELSQTKPLGRLPQLERSCLYCPRDNDTPAFTSSCSPAGSGCREDLPARRSAWRKSEREDPVRCGGCLLDNKGWWHFRALELAFYANAGSCRAPFLILELSTLYWTTYGHPIHKTPKILPHLGRHSILFVTALQASLVSRVGHCTVQDEASNPLPLPALSLCGICRSLDQRGPRDIPVTR